MKRTLHGVAKELSLYEAGCRPGGIKHSALGDISIWFCYQSSPGERNWREGGGQPAPACSLFPMDLIVFQGSLKALTYFFLQETFSHLGQSTWLVSGRSTFLLSLLSDMWALSQAFRKVFSLNLVKSCHFTLPCEAFQSSMKKRGEELYPFAIATPVTSLHIHFMYQSTKFNAWIFGQ